MEIPFQKTKRPRGARRGDAAEVYPVVGYRILFLYEPDGGVLLPAALLSARAVGGGRALARLGGGRTALLHLWMRARRAKKHQTREQQERIADLAFHLAMEEPQNSAELIARSLRAAGFDDARAEGGCVTAAGKRAFLRFRLEKVTADELSPVIRAAGNDKAVLAGGFTDEAKRLAEAFGVKLYGAEQVYELVQKGGQMPEPLIAPPRKKQRCATGCAPALPAGRGGGTPFRACFCSYFRCLPCSPSTTSSRRGARARRRARPFFGEGRIRQGRSCSFAVLVRFLGKEE